MSDRTAEEKKELKITPLEPRIMLSATWIDADTGDGIDAATGENDIFYGTEGVDIADALGGDDILFGYQDADILTGGNGADILDGGTGDDQLFGGNQNDILTSGGGNDFMDGGNHDDLFQVTGAQAGDSITIDGGQGNDTIDLSGYNSTDVADDGSTITVQLDGGGSFSIQYSNIETVEVNDAPVGSDDSVATNEDTAITTGSVLANDSDPNGDSLSVDSFTQPSHGTVAYNNDGTFSYTPDDNYNGDDSFTYTVTDSNGATDTATVNISVGAVNDAPVGGSDSVSTTEDTLVTTGNVLANDSDVDGDVVSLSDFTQPSHGTVAYNNDGTFTYTPEADYNGSDSFTYTIADGNGGTDTVTVDVSVGAVNDAPVAAGDIVTVDEDGSVVTGNVLANDSDVDGDALSVSDFTQPSHGTVTYNNDGTFSYTPDANYNGADSFTYMISDGNGETHTATVDVTVNSVNDAPMTVSETATTNEDTAVTIGNVLANDSDIDGDDLTVDSFTQPDHGTVVYNGDGTFTYTPEADYNGSDSFTYTVGDGNGGTSVETIDLTVNAVNDAPVATGDTVTVDEDGSVVTGNVLANDSDVDGDALSVSDFTQPSHGTVTYNNDGTFSYTPDANYNGADSFTYTISDGNSETHTATVDVTVNSVNDAPVTESEAATTNEDTAVTTDNVLANDSDIDGDDLAVDSFTQPDHGTVVYNGDGTFTYTPDLNYNGADSFTYTVGDGNGGTDVATINLTVNAVNDAPTPGNDQISVDEDSMVTTGNLLANDLDVDGNDFFVHGVSEPTHGTVVYEGDGRFTYIPDANYNGTDSFTYTINDGVGGMSTATVEVTVNSVNDDPEAERNRFWTDEDTVKVTGNVLENDYDLDADTLDVGSFEQSAHGTVVYNGDGTFTYTPDDNFNGIDTFQYTVTDGNGGTATANVQMTVRPVNDVPQGVADSVTVSEDGSVTTGNVLANDVDIDGDVLHIAGYSQPEHGSVSYNNDGTFTYNPDANYNGADSFTYRIIDGNGAEQTITVNVNIEAVNDAPEAGNDSISTLEDNAVTTGNLLENDSDLDGDTLTIDNFTAPSHGSLTYNNDGTFTYTPDADYNGSDSFNYTVTDGNGETDTATVQINVSSVNDAAVTVGDSYTVQEDVAQVVGDVLINDTDVEGNTLGIIEYSQPEHGTVSSNGDGTFVYTPDNHYHGEDSFTYTVSDGRGATTTETISITVESVNDAPDAPGKAYTSVVNEVITTDNVLAASTDMDGDDLTLDSFTQPEHGTVVDNGDGTFTYTPDSDYNGTDSFTYTISDGNGGTDTATIELTVGGEAANPSTDAVNDSFSTDYNTPLTTDNVLANDIDADGNGLTIDSFTQPGNGTVVDNGNGTFTYTPNNGFSGSDSFTYTVIDSSGHTDTATVSISVDAASHAPDANNDSYTTDEDTAVTTGNVLANDTDLDGDTITLDSFTQADHGTVVSHGDGTFTYTPDADYNGADSFTYTVSDSNGGTDTATVTIQVNGVIDGMQANDDSMTLDEDHTVTTVDVTNNDINAEGGHTMFVSDFTQPDHGSLRYNDDGTFTYTPDANYYGSDSFTYTLYDGEGHSDIATMHITVNPVNDAPTGRNDSYSTQEDNSVTTGVVTDNDSDIENDALTLDSLTQADHGTVVSHGDGTFTYTPDANYHGSDSFTYTISDEDGLTDTVTVNIQVSSVNDNPVALDDIVSVDEDSHITTGNVLGNDSDVDGDKVLVYDYTDAAHGSLKYNGDGTFTYYPEQDFNGSDSFDYTVIDGKGGSTTATVSITVNSVNDTPEAQDLGYATDEDTPFDTDNVFSFYDNVDDETLSIDSFTQPANGTVVYNGDGTFTYTPDADYNGNESFSYTIIDELGASDTATINIRVDAVNDAPVAAEDGMTFNEDETVTTINVLNNDVDVDGNPLSIPWFTQPEHGTVTYNGDGTFNFVPDQDYNGADSFTYTVIDGQGGMDVETITLTINPVNDAPVGRSDTYGTDEDTAVTTGNVLTNDTDVDGDVLTVDSFTQAGNGTVVYNNDGTFTYTPNADYNGSDTFTYDVIDAEGVTDTVTVTVNVTPVNDAPVAVGETLTVQEDVRATTGNVLANDTDVDIEPLSIDSFTQPSYGKVTYNGDGTFSYRPSYDYYGSDSFTYTVSDGNGGFDTATMEITINPVNDAPRVRTDYARTDEDTTVVTGNVLANDYEVEGEDMTFEGFAQPEHGTVVYNNDGTFTYTPDENFNGSDRFSYTLSDIHGARETGWVRVTVDAVNDAPEAAGETVNLNEDVPVNIDVLTNDSDLDGDTMSIQDFVQPEHGTVVNDGNGVFTYTPDSNYNGTDSFTYTITDGNGLTDTATVNLTVQAVNDAPDVADETIVVDEDNSVLINDVLSNDSDIENDTLVLDSFTEPAHGSLTYHEDGSFTYTPDEHYHGADGFTYTVIDGNGGSTTGTVQIQVNSVNDAPVTANDAATTAEDVSQTISVLGNDSDADGDALTISDFGQGAHGSVVHNVNGVFTYTPDEHYHGADSFTYTVSDGNGGVTTATVSVTVDSVNDAPDIVNETISVDEDNSIVINNVLSNDSDVDNDTLVLDSFTEPAHGSLTYHEDGSFTYTPDEHYHGADSFTYTVIDGNGGSTTGTVQIQVNSVNDAPVTVNDTATTAEDTSTTISVLGNDSDADGDVLTISDFGQGAHGSVVHNGNGVFTYTPDADYRGADSFTYTVSDGNGGITTATVSVTVDSVNDAPVAPNQTQALDEDQTVQIDWLSNASDVDGDTLSLVDFEQPTHGTLTDNGDGTFSYHPDENYHGADSFTYTITDGNGETVTATVDLTIGAVNDAPTIDDSHVSVQEDGVVTTANILLTAEDVEGDAVEIIDFGQAANGSVAYHGDGSFTYTPDADYHGSDQFTYTISDGNGGLTQGTVFVEVSSVNDAPVAVNDQAVAEEDMSVVVVSLVNDTDIDGDTLTVSGFTQPEHGTVGLNADGSFSYTPDADYNGADSFTYTVSDGQDGFDTAQIAIDVQARNDAPQAAADSVSTVEDQAVRTHNVLTNDTDIENDALTVADFSQPEHGVAEYHQDGTFTYTPNENYHGSDSFTYTISDGNGGYSESTITIQVDEVNDAPQAADDQLTTNEDESATTGNVLANDGDIDGDTLQIADYSQPEHGAIEYNQDGSFTYTPDADYHGADSFTYTVSDGRGGVHTASVTINVRSVNDLPVVNAGEDGAMTESDELNLNGQASDVDGDQLTYQWVQIDGPDVTIVDGDTLNPTIVPGSISSDSEVVLELRVSDGTAVVTDSVTVQVEAEDDDRVVPQDDTIPDPKNPETESTDIDRNDNLVDDNDMEILDPVDDATLVQLKKAFDNGEVITQESVNLIYEADVAGLETTEFDRNFENLSVDWGMTEPAQMNVTPPQITHQNSFDEIYLQQSDTIYHDIIAAGSETPVEHHAAVYQEAEHNDTLGEETDEMNTGALGRLWMLIRNVAGVVSRSDD